MSSPAPIDYRLDQTLNLVRTGFRGHVTAIDFAAHVARMQVVLAQTRAGFTILVDFTSLDTMDLDCGPHLAQLMDLCRVHQVGRIVRVVPDRQKDIGLNILSIIHYRGSVPILTLDTLAEAERVLD